MAKTQFKVPKDIDLDRMGELVAAERAGRCKVLPCNVGEPVWILYRSEHRIQQARVDSFHLFDSRRDTVETCEIGDGGAKIFRRWKINQFGKALFLNEAEARAALMQRK